MVSGTQPAQWPRRFETPDERRLQMRAIQDALSWDPEDMARTLREDGGVGDYPRHLTDQWARGKLSTEQWLDELNKWAKQLVEDNKDLP